MAVEGYAKLKTLAHLFSPYATLYKVGGCVRDDLLGVECYDVDVCSKLAVDDVKKILSNTDFVVSNKSLRMGTVHISSGDFCVEYTTFRTESYDTKSGAHSPCQVSFTDDMLLDAKRRDFKCNAIYYDIENDKIVDLLGGVDDIKNKVISSADDPQIVFEADGLRILRLVRFCAELGFECEEKTFEVARQNAWRVRDIAVERVRDELDKIFVADTRHKSFGLKDAHLRGFRMLDALGLVDLILPELASLKGLEQPAQYHLYDAFEHSVKAFEIAPPHLRWVSLLHDVGKAKAVALNGNMHEHDLIGVDMASDILSRLRFSNDKKRHILQLIRWHMIDINGNMAMTKLRRFVVEHLSIVEDLCQLKDIDGLASAGELTRPNRLREAYDSLIADGVPLTIGQLKVSGADLVELGIEANKRGELLKQLLIDTALNPILNDRERAIKYLLKASER